MAESEEEEAQIDAESKPKKGRKGLFLTAGLSLVAAGAGYGAVTFGVLDSLLKEKPKSEQGAEYKTIEFVPLDPMVISLGPAASSSHLRFVAQLEVTKGNAKAVAALQPRVMDTLNTYLRAVTEEELREPASIMKLRAQMLRRIQVVLGEGLVNDLLVIEFVLN